MRSNPELARRSSKRHSKVVNKPLKESTLTRQSSSRAHASKSLTSGSSVVGSVRRPQRSTVLQHSDQQPSAGVQDPQAYARTLAPTSAPPTTLQLATVPPALPNQSPPRVGRSATMPAASGTATRTSNFLPTYPSRASHDVSSARSPPKSSFREVIAKLKLKRMLRRVDRGPRERSGIVTSFDSLPSNSSMFDRADARSSRTSLMSDLSRLGDVAYVDVVAESDRVKPESATSQAHAAASSTPSHPHSTHAMPSWPSKAPSRLEARAPAPRYAARTTDVESWRKARREFMLVLQEGPAESVQANTDISNPPSRRRQHSFRPSLFHRRRPSSRSRATLTPCSFDVPLERSRTLEEPTTLPENVTVEPN